MTSLLSRAIDAVARARSPSEPQGPGAFEPFTQPELERPVCPLCGHTRARVELAAPDTWLSESASAYRFQVARCEVCAHRYTTPRFRRADRMRAFSDAYPFYIRAKRARGGTEEASLNAAREPFLGRAARVRAMCPRPGRLLDLGAGDGFFLDVMRDHGWTTQGIDMDPDVVWYARERLGLQMTEGDIEEDPLAVGPFDVVTLWGVLQLVYEPRRLLARVREVMAPDAVLAIGVSNIRSVGARMFGSRWRGLGLPRHLSHFTPDTLTRLLQWSGYGVRSIHFETPRWVIAGSVDASPIGPARKPAKAALYAGARMWERSRWADTFEVYASVRRG